MSFVKTPLRLVLLFALFLLIGSICDPDSLRAQVQLQPREVLCSSAQPLAWEAQGTVSTPSGVYSLEFPDPGVLALYVSVPPRPGKNSVPNLALVEERCGGTALPPTYDLIQETPQGLLLRLREPQSIRIAVQPEDPSTPFKVATLRVAFVEESEAPDAMVSLGVNPPGNCSLPTAPALGEGEFEGNRFVVVERDLSTTEPVEPEDCDILDGVFAHPGVVVIESSGTPLQAALFAGHGCDRQAQIGDGTLESSEASVAVPVHAGAHRLLLEPLNGDPVTYSLKVRHFDLCRLGAPDDHGGQPLCASPLKMGATATGILDEGVGGDEDFFTFILERQRTVAIEHRGAGTVTLYDHRGQRLGADPLETLDGYRLIRTLGPGRHYLSISGPEGRSARYSVHWQDITDR
jgi:hypothetical protein